ncbi:MAG: hypothetical protein M0R46_01615 [Candidatus Muirbacterium halophilum]|nr:hypothetical protein [Candidatus Muirbacterium halophilum]
MINFEKLVKNNNNGILNFFFPYLPSIKKPELIYSDNSWNTISQIEMQPDEKLQYFHTSIKTFDKDICFRYSYELQHTKEKKYFEDNNKNNFYFKNSKLYIQNLNNPEKSLIKIIEEGKNLIYSDSTDNNYIIFNFNNIFYFKSILENFKEFLYIDTIEKKDTLIIKKINNVATWDTDIFNPNISSDLRNNLKNLLKSVNFPIGIVNITKKTHNYFFLLYFFTNLQLDYIIKDSTLYWKKNN